MSLTSVGGGDCADGNWLPIAGFCGPGSGRFGKQDFVYIPEEDAYRCPAGQRLTWRFTSAEEGMTLHSYWTSKCAECPLKTQCTTGKERRIKRWEHEAVIDAMQDRLDRAPKSMCPAPDGGHAGLRPHLKSSCFSACPSKFDNRKPPASQPSADHASAFLHSLHPLRTFGPGVQLSEAHIRTGARPC